MSKIKVEGTNKLVPFTDGYPEDFKVNLNKYLEEYITDNYGEQVRKKNIVVNVNY
jgi:hypothetical protein